MLSPQQIVTDILPAMQQALGAGAVMAEAKASAPNMEHFDRSAPDQTAPLVETPSVEVEINAGYTFNQSPGLS